jgi:hypothetical protein
MTSVSASARMAREDTSNAREIRCQQWQGDRRIMAVNHPAIRAGSLPVSQVANLPGYCKIPNKT